MKKAGKHFTAIFNGHFGKEQRGIYIYNSYLEHRMLSTLNMLSHSFTLYV